MNPSLAGAPDLEGRTTEEVDENLRRRANQQNAYNGLYDQYTWAKNVVSRTAVADASGGAVAATYSAATQGAEHVGELLYNGYKETNYNNDTNHNNND